MIYKKIALLIGLSLLTACKEDNKNTMEMPKPEVGVITIKETSVPLTSELTGRTVAKDVAEIRPQITGIIKERLFKEGQIVKSGDILYKIDDSTYKAAYDQAVAALKSSQAQVSAAQSKAWRYNTLIKNNSVSKEDVDNANSSYKQILANIEEAKANVETAKINLERTSIKAPISGKIGISQVTPGSLVTANQESALAVIRNLDEMYVDVTQSSVKQLELKKNLKNKSNKNNNLVSLKLEDGSIYDQKGHLETSEVAVDPSTGSVLLRAIFPNPDYLLLPGMFVRATITNDIIDNAILAPQQGITRDMTGQATAFIVDKDNKVKQIKLTTEKAIGNNWLVSSGLKSGDKLVIEGTNKIRNDQEVKIIDIETINKKENN